MDRFALKALAIVILGLAACGDEAGGNSAAASGGGIGSTTAGGAATKVTSGAGGSDLSGPGGSSSAGGAGIVPVTIDGSAQGLGGSGAIEAGVVSACGEVAPPAGSEPTIVPDPITADPGAVTMINDGDVDQAATNVAAVSQGAGMSQGMQGSSAVWKWKQAGAFLEYTLKAVTAGTYTVNVVYFAAQEGGTADVLLNGTNVGKVTFGTTAKVGGYGGIPNGLSRGPGTAMNLVAGNNKVRILFTPRSTPVDVFGLQVNFSGQALSNAAKIQRLSTQTALQSDAPSDFYRIHYTPSSQSWNCQRSYCLVEYFVETEKAGSYALTMKYAGASTECSGVRFLVNGEPQAELQLPPGAGVTGPKTIQLPCGVSRLSIRNANYLTGGAYCAYGAQYGQVELKPLP